MFVKAALFVFLVPVWYVSAVLLLPEWLARTVAFLPLDALFFLCLIWAYERWFRNEVSL